MNLKKCNCESDNNLNNTDNKNNGFITKIWGESGWIFLHTITFGYPLNPTDEQKKQYKDFFTSVGNVLPCKYCRESYHQFISTGDTELTDQVMENRETLTRWFYRVHEAVNRKLEMDYAITYDDIVERYESFRAKCPKKNDKIIPKGCTTPLDYKAFSFRKLYLKDCPIVPLETVEPFIKLARIRGLGDEYFGFIPLVRELGGDFNKLKKQESWQYRNKWCQQQIKYMRENAIPSLEEEGEWKGTPTKEELALLMFLSSNLGKSELDNAIKIFESKS